jgi:hypothetical protein
MSIGPGIAAIALVALVLATTAMIVRARAAILAGNWLRHRQHMLAALGLWAVALALALALLVVARPAPPSVIGVPLAAAAGVSVLLLRVLQLMAQHRLLEHKLLARRVIWAWSASALLLGAAAAAAWAGSA